MLFTYSPSVAPVRIHGGGIHTYDDSSKKSTTSTSTRSTRPYDLDNDFDYDEFQCTQEAADECDRTIKNFERVINTTPSQRKVSKSHILVVKLTKKVREMTKMVQVLQKKLESYEDKEFNEQILAGDVAFNEACMQIDLSPPIKTNLPTSTSTTTKPTTTNNTYITPQHNSHRPTPQQIHHSPTFGISPIHQNSLQHRNTTSYSSNYHHNFNPHHHTTSTVNNSKNDFQRPRPVNPYANRTYRHSTGG